MRVKLISKTEGVGELAGLSLTELIGYTARVSNPANQLNHGTSERLINYMLDHKHWSPFEMVNICLEIETTRDIARQILRHSSAKFQEFCIAGDSELYFLQPKFFKKGSYKPTSKMTIREFYDKWHNGAAPINNGFRIPMRDRLEKMRIKCVDEETGKLTTANIKNVFFTGRKEVFKITLDDGKTIKATKDHKFYTKNGFQKLEDIIGLVTVNKKATMTIKDPVIGVNGQLVSSGSLLHDKEWLAEAKKQSLFKGGGIKWIAQTYGLNYNTIRKWLRRHGLIYSKKETCIVVPPWNKGKTGYKTKPMSDATKLKMRASARKGPASNLWKGGPYRKREPLDAIESAKFVRENNYTCNRCRQKGGRLNIHHRIPFSERPDLLHVISNWELLCVSCHRDHHKAEERQGWQRIGVEASRQKSYEVKWTTVKYIELIGEEDTYDLEVDHSSHNYVANGIIVHNSQRYADPNQMEFHLREARLQDAKNRQNSVEAEDMKLQMEWLQRQAELTDLAKQTYEWAINNGLAKEQARCVMPEGLTPSKLYMNASLRTWIHYLQVRTGPETQKEHREVALACKEAIAEVFPMIGEVVGEYE